MIWWGSGADGRYGRLALLPVGLRGRFRRHTVIAVDRRCRDLQILRDLKTPDHPLQLRRAAVIVIGTREQLITLPAMRASYEVPEVFRWIVARVPVDHRHGLIMAAVGPPRAVDLYLHFGRNAFNDA